MSIEDVGREAGFKIRIHNEGPYPATSLAKIVSTLSRAFEVYSKTRSAKLGISHVRSGSIEIIFDILDVAKIAHTHRDVLAGFAANIADAITLIRAGSTKGVSAAARRAIEAMAESVANDNLREIVLSDDRCGVEVFIRSNDAEMMLRILRQPKPMAAIEYRALQPRGVLTEQQAVELETTGLEGTAAYTLDTWYARLVGQRGVMLPIEADASIKAQLEHGVAYRFTGRVLRDARGVPYGAQITSLQRLGR